nr:helix-turn-helix domain-containing protein [Virgibacillus oceani]
MYMEIKQLLKQGFSKVKVAEKLGISRVTVYRYLYLFLIHKRVHLVDSISVQNSSWLVLKFLHGAQ